MIDDEDGSFMDAARNDLLRGQSRNIVKFYKSKTNGKDYVMILCPGMSKGNPMHRAATENDKIEYPNEWAAYERGSGGQYINGTCIEMLPGVPAGVLEEARLLNVVTIEAAAELSDLACQKFMGALALRERARQYMNGNNDENMRLRARVAELERAISEMKDAGRPEAPRRGRPRKHDNADHHPNGSNDARAA
jgi:hypothetical protein